MKAATSASDLVEILHLDCFLDDDPLPLLACPLLGSVELVCNPFSCLEKIK
jgi:hypothetical protein